MRSNSIFCSISQKQFLVFLGTFVLFFVCFRTTISILFGQVIADGLILTVAIVFPFLLIKFVKRQLYGMRAFLTVYILYCFFMVFFAPSFSNFGSIFGAMIGFTNLALFPVFWLVLLSESTLEENIKKYGFFVIFIGSINAVGAIIQSTVSVNLFGLISHGVYTDPSVLENENVSKRAVSFIVSPQSLSLFLAFCLAFSFVYKWHNSFFKYFFRGLIFFSAVLTVSKVFFVFVFVFVFFAFFSIKRIFDFFLGLVVFFVGIFIFKDELGRVIELVYFVSSFDKYSAFVIWKDSLIYALDPYNFLFGHGIGVFSRGAQSILGYTLLYGSTESFFIQVFAETGLVGLMFLWALIFKASLVLIKINRKLFATLMGFFVVGFFTPAIYGYSIGLFFYFVLVLPLASQKDRGE